MAAQIADTTAGKVRGGEIDVGILAWRGIPYAAAPVGPLRLRPPRPVVPWSGVRDATEYAAPALQPEPQVRGMFGSADVGPRLPPPSEDCLYLNVTAPADAERRPVLVWLHGGGYQMGTGTDGAGDGASFVRSHGLVVVTLNYRVGALGFLVVDGEEDTGALGLHDQIAALRWVHDNIASFGGDPGQVTVYGISAGAKSVANILASPLARGLVRRAASSSGGVDHVATPAQATAVARRFFRELGTGPQRIREASAADILGAQNAIGTGMKATWLWRPMIDGLAITAAPVDAIERGSAAGIPLLAQHCVNECGVFQLAEPDAADQADRVLEGYFGAAGRDEVLDAYRRARPDLDAVRLRVEVMTDERYAIPTTRLADAQSAHAPVWRSRYDGPVTGLPPAIAPAGSLPAFHGVDAAAIWAGGTLLHDVWGAFATTGAPTGVLPEWPGYTTGRRPTMIFDNSAGPHVVEYPDGPQRRAWDGRHWQSGTWWSLDEIT